MATISYWCWCNHLGDNPPLMISMHQLTSLGNFGTFSNFSLFFVPWNIALITFCHYPQSLSFSNCITWVIVLTNSKDFKWFRRSPLLHSSWNHVIKIITIVIIVIGIIIITTWSLIRISWQHWPEQGRKVTFRCTLQAFWRGLGGSSFSSPFNQKFNLKRYYKVNK